MDSGVKSNRRFKDEEMRMSANELEFLAEMQEIFIVPRFRFDAITLLQRNSAESNGQYGPFQPMKPVIVPLWLALQLKQQKLCTITSPSWMSIDSLENILQTERANRESNLLGKVDFYYQETAKILMQHSPESFENVEKVRILIKDIEEIRALKLHASLRELQDHTEAARFAHLSAAELNSIRAFMIEAMNKFSDLRKAELAVTSSSQPSQQIGSL
mmetsp:Transcript_53683/g.142294  ORF Transcript_53683/g.142294 Transcript_53683/m.142294 type:complete len:216 (+) Transcript_53683:70-717(+)